MQAKNGRWSGGRAKHAWIDGEVQQVVQLTVKCQNKITNKTKLHKDPNREHVVESMGASLTRNSTSDPPQLSRQTEALWTACSLLKALRRRIHRALISESFRHCHGNYTLRKTTTGGYIYLRSICYRKIPPPKKK